VIGKLGLKPLNDVHELPVYGTDRRVKVKSLRGPWQEIEMRIHRLDEIDHKHFWQFLEQAVAGFKRITQRVQQDPESIMPWTVLGRKWHVMRKGFPPGKKIAWEPEVLEELLKTIETAAPTARFQWNNHVTVNVMANGRRDPWIRLLTKKPAAVELILCGPKGRFTMGRIADLGCEPVFDGSRAKVDVIRLQFVTQEDLRRGDLAAFLHEHASAIESNSQDLPLFEAGVTARRALVQTQAD